MMLELESSWWKVTILLITGRAPLHERIQFASLRSLI
jgi:hypothetical protein